MVPRKRSGLRGNTRNEGFTLVELLIVIAIIALLAAILFPVFARARENARRTACLSNMKQISMGIFQYAQDYDERLPNYTTDVNDPLPNFNQKVYLYVKSESVFRCPNVKKMVGDFTDGGYSTYGLIGRPPNLNNPLYVYWNYGFHLAQSTYPGKTYMMVETQEYAGRWYTNGWGSIYVNFASLTANANLADEYPTDADCRSVRLMCGAHFGGYNTAFLDGHVKWMKLGSETGYIPAVKNQ